MLLEPGSRIGAYEVVSQIGGGGMGLVYQVKDTRLERFAALKLLPPDRTRDENAKERFVQEAKAASALDTAIEVAQGLAKAHGSGIVHRDIKPANSSAELKRLVPAN